MKSAWGLTGLMGLLAAALAMGAALFYPWPEPIETNALVNQKLFGELDVKLAKTMSIVSFDRENRRFDSIELRRVADSWFVPNAGDYPAGNVSRIAGVFSALSESTILEVKSSDESNHQLYGVIDSEMIGEASNQTGIGTKLSLADNNNRPLAQMIIGETVGSNNNQRFVRVAGQPSVYVIEFPETLLSTKLTDWVDHNLLDLKLAGATSGLEVTQLQVDNYIIEGQSLTKDSTKKYNFRARVNLKDQSSPLTVFKPTADGTLGEPIADRRLNGPGLNALASNLAQVPFSAVERKPAAATEAILAGISETSDLSSLANFGFRQSTEMPARLDSKNGQLTVTTSEGVDWTLSFGSVAANKDLTQTQVNYYLLIAASANEGMFPLPPEPSDKENEDQRKDYERAIKRREDSLAANNERAKQYNQRHAPWLYLISEDALLALRPDEANLIQ